MSNITLYPIGTTYYRKERIERENAKTLAIGLLLMLMVVVGLFSFVL